MKFVNLTELEISLSRHPRRRSRRLPQFRHSLHRLRRNFDWFPKQKLVFLLIWKDWLAVERTENKICQHTSNDIGEKRVFHSSIVELAFKINSSSFCDQIVCFLGQERLIDKDFMKIRALDYLVALRLSNVISNYDETSIVCVVYWLQLGITGASTKENHFVDAFGIVGNTRSRKLSSWRKIRL